MADRLRALLFCVVLWPVGAVAQQWDYVALQHLETAVADLNDPLSGSTIVDQMGAVMAEVGLTRNPGTIAVETVEEFVPDAGAVVELVDIRLLLTQIAIQSGARDHVALVRAQGAREHDVILLRGGFATLSDLWTLSRGTLAQDFVTVTPEGIVLTRPLAIWSDAGLTFAATDHLILDRPSGSFVANLGWLDLSGGSIIGSDTQNLAEPGFRPFIMTAGQGRFTAEGATFQAMGFGASEVFGGIAVVNNGLLASPFASFITDSTLIGVATLGLVGTSGAVLSGNRVIGAAGPAILIAQSQDTVVADNRLAALSGAQAIRVTAASSGVLISDNFLTGSARIGILIDRDSSDVTVTGNLITGSQTTGIGVSTATCVMLNANLVADNGGTGINLSDTDQTIAQNNAILFNRSSGVLLRDQAEPARVELAGNVLIGNRDGIRGATTGNVSLAGNHLDGQMPRIYAGDFAPLTVEWLRNRHDTVPVSMQAPTALPCTSQGNG